MIVKNKSMSHQLAVLPCAKRFDKISVHIIRRPMSAFVIDIKLTILEMTGPIDGRNSTYDVHMSKARHEKLIVLPSLDSFDKAVAPARR